MYQQCFPNREVNKVGLTIHPEKHWLAASPDRRVLGPSYTPQEGLMEVKCLFATTDPPQTAAAAGKGVCLKVIDGQV